MNIREAGLHDQDAMWEIFHEVVVQGDTWVFDADTPRSFMIDYWFHPGTLSYVAEQDGRVVPPLPSPQPRKRWQRFRIVISSMVQCGNECGETSTINRSGRGLASLSRLAVWP
jgi:hypothetical protein